MTASYWIEEQQKGPVPGAMSEVIYELLVKAWQHRDNEEILKGYAPLFLSSLEHGGWHQFRQTETLPALIYADPGGRHQLVAELVAQVEDGAINFDDLIFPPDPLLQAGDEAWLMRQLEAAESPRAAQVWSALLSSFINGMAINYLDSLLSMCDRRPDLRTYFAGYLDAINLESPQAAELKAQYERQIEHRRVIDEQLPQRSERHPTAEPLVQSLALVENADTAGWVGLVGDMTVGSGRRTAFASGADVTELPGWRNADGTARQRILHTAEQYLRDDDPHAERWLGTATIPMTYIRGYQALRLLYGEHPEMVNDLTSEVWKKWAPAILGSRATLNHEEELRRIELVARCYRSVPEECYRILLVQLNQDNQAGQGLISLDILDAAWNPQITALILDWLAEDERSSAAVQSALRHLLKHDITAAMQYAEQVLSIPITAEEARRNLVIAVILALLRNALDISWLMVWPVLHADEALGRMVITQLVLQGMEYHRTLAMTLSESAVADLYLWLCQLFPPDEDPGYGDDGQLRARPPIT